MSAVKDILLKSLSVPGVTAPFSLLVRDSSIIFMLHRFADPERGSEGTDPQVLRRALEYLRQRRFEFISLAEVFARLRDGRPVRKTIAFTLDDGYRDQGMVAGEVFAEYDCPATIFLTTGFIDRKLWFWWDRIEFIFRHTPRAQVQLEVGGERFTGTWRDDVERAASQTAFIALCKTVPDAEKHAAIARLAAEAEVELPQSAPAQYAPLTWDEVRACERRGLSFGPHTVTHPILSRIDDAQSQFELTESWARVKAEAAHPVPIFCYPNGRRDDFGEREIATLRRIGLQGAVVGAWWRAAGYASAREFHASDQAPFLVRRFSLPSRIEELLQYVDGVEKFKQILRQERF